VGPRDRRPQGRLVQVMAEDAGITRSRRSRSCTATPTTLTPMRRSMAAMALPRLARSGSPRSSGTSCTRALGANDVHMTGEVGVEAAWPAAELGGDPSQQAAASERRRGCCRWWRD
jgi:hypothetical protein